MRRKRRIWIRRLALGLAVAAVAAPTAQARVDEGTVPQVSHRDGGANVAWNRGSYDKIGTYSVSSFRRALPEDYGKRTAVPVGDDKVIIRTPDTYTVSSYRRALPDDYGSRTAVPVGDDKVILPGDYGVLPVADVASPGSFDWADFLIGAGAAFGLMLLAGGAALGTRRGRAAATA